VPRLFLSSGRDFLLLEGTQHGDTAHQAIMELPGWRPCKIGEHGVPKQGTYYVGPLLPASVAALKGLQQRLVITLDDGVGLAMQRVEERIRRAKTALASTALGTSTVGARDLMPHQQQALLAAEALLPEEGGGLLLADDMGLGKTTVALAFAAMRNAPRILVICPASVKWNWQREVHKIFSDEKTWWTYVYDGTPQARGANLAALQGSAAKDWPRVIVTNYDLVGAPPKSKTDKPRSAMAEEWRCFLERYVQGVLLIVDESHYIKDEDSDRSRATAAVARAARWRLLLTGTPIRNTARDLWHQLEVAQPGIWRNCWDFERRYMRHVMVKMGARKIRKLVGWRATDELGHISSFHMIRRRKDVLPGLPPKMPPIYYDIEMDEVTKRHYLKMRDWWLYEFADVPDDESVFSARARSMLEATIRLQQIAQGFISGPPFEDQRWIQDNAKASWLCQQASDLLAADRKPVVWSQFNRPLQVMAEMLQDRCKVPTILFTGELASSERQAHLDTFATEEKAIFLGQVKIAEGFNLTTSQDVIFYGRDWSPAVNAQAEDRVHRIGQTGTVSIHIPLVRGTIEHKMHQILEAKGETSKAVLTMAELREAV